MKKILAAAMVVAALILFALPPSDAVQCSKQMNCIVKNNRVADPSNDTVVECPGECASWACIIGKVGYHGKGCDTENPCKDVSGAKTSTCGTIPLAGSQCNDLQYKINVAAFDTENPEDAKQVNMADLDTCKPSKDGSKVGVMAIGGMLLLGWLIAQ